jgi:hypothetical protein
MSAGKTITVKAGGQDYALRFSMLAMKRYEDANEGNFVEAIDRFLQESAPVAHMMPLFRVAINDWTKSDDELLSIMDEVGYADCLTHMMTLSIDMLSNIQGAIEKSTPKGNAERPLKKAG